MTRHPGQQPWIGSAPVDLAGIVGPAWLATVAVLAFPGIFANTGRFPTWAWALLVLAVDVTHVYGTLWKTYLDPDVRDARGSLLLLVPALSLVGGLVLYGLGADLFWRGLAYLAVWHFVRQQYGFMRIYARHERDLPRWCGRIDLAAITGATLYPLVFWHTHMPREFSWFVDGDFIRLDAPWLDRLAGILYGGVLGAYCVKEFWIGWKTRRFNVPRNLLLGGTAASWYVGIVALDGDLAFTATNVLAHGIPYMVLVWLDGRRRVRATVPPREGARLDGRKVFSPAWLPLFVGLPLLLAYLEEGFWNGLVWREHGALFGPFWPLPAIAGSWVIGLVVPLLAVPQVTHYVLDGFIWRLERKDAPGSLFRLEA